MKTRDRLILLVKAPVPGVAKTRLSPRLSAARAAAFYRALVEDLAADLRGWKRAELWVAYAPAAPLEDPSWLGVGRARVFRQAPGHLGDRIEHAFRHGFEGGARSVVVAVSDAPGLTRRYAASAFAALRRADATLGPATDGGFNLLGLARPLPGACAGVPWSTPRALARVRANLRARGASCRLLPPLADLDGPADLDAFARARRWKKRLPRTWARLALDARP